MEEKTTIVVFSQGASESLHEAWKLYKSMLRRCLNHGFDDLKQIHIFINKLRQQPNFLLDATVDGSLMFKNTEDTIAIIKRMTLSDHQRSNVEK